MTAQVRRGEQRPFVAPLPTSVGGALVDQAVIGLAGADARPTGGYIVRAAKKNPSPRFAVVADDAVRPWLAQLTRRLCIDKLRLLARDTPSESEPDEREVDDVLTQLDEAMTVRAALDRVGDPCREILERFFCRDESYRTIGDILDIPAGTIASRISRCLEKVRSELDGRSRGSRPS